jgi:hypothetical protein
MKMSRYCVMHHNVPEVFSIRLQFLLNTSSITTRESLQSVPVLPDPVPQEGLCQRTVVRHNFPCDIGRPDEASRRSGILSFLYIPSTSSPAPRP